MAVSVLGMQSFLVKAASLDALRSEARATPPSISSVTMAPWRTR
jgi:hypothetical protein